MTIVKKSKVEKILLTQIHDRGEIISLDRWAHENEFTPWWARHCAHSAAQKGLIKLTRLSNKPGRPYRASSLEEKQYES
jgi:hypothetical protein